MFLLSMEMNMDEKWTWEQTSEPDEQNPLAIKNRMDWKKNNWTPVILKPQNPPPPPQKKLKKIWILKINFTVCKIYINVESKSKSKNIYSRFQIQNVDPKRFARISIPPRFDPGPLELWSFDSSFLIDSDPSNQKPRPIPSLVVVVALALAVALP